MPNRFDEEMRRQMPTAGMGAIDPQMGAIDPQMAVNDPTIKPVAPPGAGFDTLPPEGAGAEETVFEILPIGPEQIAKATQTLMKYKAGKANTEQRIIASEVWWKRRHWLYMDGMGNANDHRSASAWLFNCIMSKHADAIEAYPEPNILPREAGDKEEAKRLTAIVPVILQQNDYEEVYSETSWQKLKQGTRIEGIFWDASKHHGLGDVTIKRIDALNIFPEPGVSDVQNSRNLFTTELVDIDVLRERYPDKLADVSITGKALQPREYIYDDNIDTTNKAVVVDWYYKKRQGNRTVLHYVKYVDTTILFATENEPDMRERGYYDHGMYPFVFDPLFPIEGSLFGYGYIDVGKDAQESIDRLNQALEKNALMASHPRWFIRSNGSINEEEFADWTKPFVHVTGQNIDDNSLRQVQVNTLPAVYPNLLATKIEELKETTGNRDASNGGTSSGVTAASAIAAMQEQAGKTSRASTRSAYRAYARMVNMVIELIRQFYELPRQYRIIGSGGEEEFVEYSNAGLQPQQMQLMGRDMGLRLPVFDVEVSTQKMTAYTKLAQNEMALQMYQLGVLDPQNSDKALTLLDIMDFDHKELIEDKVRRNGTMYQMLVQYQQIALQLAQQSGQADIAEALAGNILGSQSALGNGGGLAAGVQGMENTEVDNVTGLKNEEHPFVTQSREKTANSTIPGGGG